MLCSGNVGGKKIQREVNKTMSIEKKSLISTLKTTKKANVAKEDLTMGTTSKAASSPKRLAPSPRKLAPSPKKLAPSPKKLAPSPKKLAPSPSKARF